MTRDATSPPAVALQGVDVRLGGTLALSNCTLALGRGERLALLGPNGAGKTTLLRTILGLVSPQGGTVACAAQRTGSLIEQPGIARQGNTSAYLEYHARLQGVAAPRPRALELLAQWEIPDAPARTLSLGQRSRLQIARCLVHDPELLLLDEPAANLDPQARHDLHERLRAWNRAGGTLLWATHDLEEAVSQATGIAVLSKGAVRWNGPAPAFPRAFPASQLAEFDRICHEPELREALGPEASFEISDRQVRIRTGQEPGATLRRLVEAALPVASFAPDRHSLFESYRNALEAPVPEAAPAAMPDDSAPPATPWLRACRATLAWEASNLRRELRFFLPFAIMQSLLSVLQILSKQPNFAALCMLPAGLSASLCADAIAGERERLGLDTLRSTHAPLSAVLAGKTFLAWACGVFPGLAFLCLCAAWTGTNVLPWAATLLGCSTAATVFSARICAGAPSMRSAAQLSVLGSFFMTLGLVLATVLLPAQAWLAWSVPLLLATGSLAFLPGAARRWARP